MKNQIYILAFLFVSIAVTLSSCKKFDFDRHHEEESLQISNDSKEIKVNESLTYVLPEGFNKETPVISTQAKNFGNSTLTQDASTGNWTYSYTPVAGFIGSDQVSIDSENESEEHERRPRKGHGKCGDHQNEGAHLRLVLDISVVGEPANK